MADETIAPDADVTVVDGVGPARSEDLEAAGYPTVKDLQQASFDELSGVVRPNVARQIKDQVGNRPKPVTSVAEGKEKAQQIPGAKAKTVRHGDGSQEVRVIEKDQEQSVPGAHLTVRKG